MEFKFLKSFFLCGLQIGSGHPRPCSEDDMESPFPKELTLQQVRQHALTSTGLYSRRRQRSNINRLTSIPGHISGFLRLPDPADDRQLCGPVRLQ